MKQILRIFIIVTIFSSYLKAGNLAISIIENSIKLKNDSISFNFKITNTSTHSLAFYRFDDIAFYWSPLNTEQLVNIGGAVNIVYVYNSKNELPNGLKVSSSPAFPDVLVDSLGNISISNQNLCKKQIIEPIEVKRGKQSKNSTIDFIFLLPGETFEKTVKHDLWELGLKNGKHKILMVYLSGEKAKNKFSKLQNRNKSLKKYSLFVGKIESNEVWFDYTPRSL